MGRINLNEGPSRDFKPLTSWLNINPVTLHESFLPEEGRGRNVQIKSTKKKRQKQINLLSLFFKTKYQSSNASKLIEVRT